MAKGGYSEQELSEAYEKMCTCLDRAEAGLNETFWLVETSTLWPISPWFPLLTGSAIFGRNSFRKMHYPKLRAWYGRLSARPAFEKAFRFTADPRAKELPNF